MANEVENYLLDVERYREAYKNAIQLVQQVKQFAEKLNNWRGIAMEKAAPFDPVILPALGIESPSLNSSDWPSVEQLDTVLIAYYRAYDAIQEAYQAIPSNIKDVVVKPSIIIAEVEGDGKQH